MTFPCTVDFDLELLPLEPLHAVDLFTLVERDREYLHQWQNWPDHLHTLEDMIVLIENAQHKRAANTGLDLVMVVDGQPAGKISLVFIDWITRHSEIGYWLGESFQGRGIVTRACRALLDYAFDEINLHLVDIRCAVGNIRSRAIPERLGFTFQGVLPYKTPLRDQFIDEVLYSMDAVLWHQLRELDR